jgi:AcrR family transcriptional regulator
MLKTKPDAANALATTAAAKKPRRPRSSKAATQPRAQRAHDAQATKKLIADAALQLLSDQGFPALGINAIANAAGVDKQLIYYHFGGLEGLIRHLGGELPLWLGSALQARANEPYAQAASRLMLEYSQALRNNTLVLRLLAWELIAPSAILAELEQARSVAMMQWLAEFRSKAAPPPDGVDAPALNALLMAGLHYLALREKSVGQFMGVDIHTDAGFARIAKAVELVTRKVYETNPSPSLHPKTPTPAKGKS